MRCLNIYVKLVSPATRQVHLLGYPSIKGNALTVNCFSMRDGHAARYNFYCRQMIHNYVWNVFMFQNSHTTILTLKILKWTLHYYIFYQNMNKEFIYMHLKQFNFSNSFSGKTAFAIYACARASPDTGRQALSQIMLDVVKCKEDAACRQLKVCIPRFLFLASFYILYYNMGLVCICKEDAAWRQRMVYFRISHPDPD